MAQFYSDPTREDKEHALPNCEAFYADNSDDWENENGEREPMQPGWYYWYCFPGCLPDSDPIGPFKSKAEAIEAARDEARI